jgi:hypothetical protein
MARVKPDELSSLVGYRITNRAHEHWKASLERIDDARGRGRAGHLKFHLTRHLRDRLEVGGKDDPNHASV